jgi:hypothetical protein
MYWYTDSKSDGYQESYVLTILEEKKNGYYLELGSADPFEGNNTSLLESEFGWKGLALDTDEAFVKKYNEERRNECIAADALTFDYKKYFEENNFPKEMDYLQIDIDGHETNNCLLALLAVPMLQYRFAIIQIEHDVINDYKNKVQRDAQREILSSLGYKLSGVFLSEDWWVDPNLIPQEDVLVYNTSMIPLTFMGQKGWK